MTEKLLNGLHKKSESLQTYSWKEVEQHSTKENAWIVIEDLVLDVSDFMKRHPGGARIISQYAGQDASEVWSAMHIDKEKVVKFMQPLVIGRVDPISAPAGEFWDKRQAITKDFREIRQHAEDSGWFKADPVFYGLILAHVILLEVMAFALLYWDHTNWINYYLAAIFLVISQTQCAYNGHDYGHHSVMPTTSLNHIMFSITMTVFMGVSAHWWNFKHSLHHSKPNILGKDPDISLANLFLIGNKIPKLWAEKRKGLAPYSLRHIYFFLLAPPFLLSVFFQYDFTNFIIKRKNIKEGFFTVLAFSRLFLLFGGILGFTGALKLFVLVKILQSIWFTFITQMSHIPMEVEDKDTPNIDWVTLQTASTCDVTPSAFNNWFTGHLNLQIEHHLFPTMPRHNLVKVVPLVKSLCKKHNIPYVEKSLTTAFADIYRSLKTSADLWNDTYYKTEGMEFNSKY